MCVWYVLVGGDIGDWGGVTTIDWKDGIGYLVPGRELSIDRHN